MKTLSFCAYQDWNATPLNHCSSVSLSRELVVNCAGQFVTSKPFTTYNASGRLDYYLLHVLSGELEIPMADTTVLARRGSAVVFPPNESYRYTYRGGAPLCYHWVHFTGSAAAERIAASGFSSLPSCCTLKESEPISEGFLALYRAFSKNDAYRDRELSLCLERILISLGRATDGGKGDVRELDASLHYLMTSYASEIRIPDLAAMEHLSTPRYNAKFKAQMGVSPTQYLLQLRLGAACDLLKNTDFSIKEVAAMCGYRDPYFFSRAFKEQLGVSPRAYRQGAER